MTENELEKLRLSCRAEAAEILLRVLVAATVRSLPNAKQQLREMGKKMRENYQDMRMPGFPAEYSDLYAGEFQDAVDSLIGQIEKDFLSNPDPEI